MAKRGRRILGAREVISPTKDGPTSSHPPPDLSIKAIQASQLEVPLSTDTTGVKEASLALPGTSDLPKCGVSLANNDLNAVKGRALNYSNVGFGSRCSSMDKLENTHQVLEDCSENKSITLGEIDTSESDSDHSSSYDKKSKSSSKTGNVRKWADVVQNEAPKMKIVKLKKFDVQDGFTFDATDPDDLDKVWGHALIGYVAGKHPGRKAIINFGAQWGVPFYYSVHDSGWLIFKFKDKNSADLVLNEGPYFVDRKALILKHMPPGFNFSDEERYLVPVWLKLRNFPLEYWNITCLGKLLSCIGTPVAMDSPTADRRRVSFARALVEVDISKPLKREVSCFLPNGKRLTQKVEYEFVPFYCKNCCMMGHAMDACRKLAINYSDVPTQQIEPVVANPQASLIVQKSKAGVQSTSDEAPFVEVRSKKNKNKIDGINSSKASKEKGIQQKSCAAENQEEEVSDFNIQECPTLTKSSKDKGIMMEPLTGGISKEKGVENVKQAEPTTSKLSKEKDKGITMEPFACGISKEKGVENVKQAEPTTSKLSKEKEKGVANFKQVEPTMSKSSKENGTMHEVRPSELIKETGGDMENSLTFNDEGDPSNPKKKSIDQASHAHVEMKKGNSLVLDNDRPGTTRISEDLCINSKQASSKLKKGGVEKIHGRANRSTSKGGMPPPFDK